MKQNKIEKILEILIPTFFGFAPLALSETTAFRPSENKILTDNEIPLMQDCHRHDFMFIECNWLSSYPLGDASSIRVDPGFRESPRTSIIIDGDFHNTADEFRLVIDGVMYPIADVQGQQLFPLPNGTNNKLQISLISTFHGRQIVEKSSAAVIRKISIYLDNTALIDNILSNLPEQVESLRWSIREYERQKKLLKFFSQTTEEIGELKQNMTGRAIDDFSGDCTVPTRLEADECSLLQTMNQVLQGEIMDFSEENKQTAFLAMHKSAECLTKTINQLDLAQKAIAPEILRNYETALKLLQKSTEEHFGASHA